MNIYQALAVRFVEAQVVGRPERVSFSPHKRVPIDDP